MLGQFVSPNTTLLASVLALLTSALAVAFVPAGLADDPDQETQTRTAHAPPDAGIERRTPWSRSQVKGSPDPPAPYQIESAFPKLKFVRPIEITAAPGSDRWFLAELDGKIYSFPPDPQCEEPDLFFDLLSHEPKAQSIYGLTFHPQFEQNRLVYVCYVLKGDLPDGTRVSRFEVTRTDPPQVVPDTEQILITWLGGGHNGGCLKFGHDGMLYIATGDGTGPWPPDVLDTGQDLTDLLASILRIDVDHADPNKGYGVPPDNPFVELEGARPEIWAYGFRNPWKMSVDRATGELWTGDVGWELWELVYRVERAGNYGWSVMEGRQPVHPEGKRGPTQISPPVMDHPHSEAASVTGGFVYRGADLPELRGAYVYGDYVTGKIWGLRYDGTRVTWQRELVDTPLQVIAFGEDHSGELVVMDYETTGQIYRLIPNPAPAANRHFPRTLSETGLFDSVKEYRPAPGVIAYSINAPLWADSTTAERLLALPGEAQITWDKELNWKFPEGTVLARTVSMELEHGQAASRRRLETQLLHLEDNTWRPYSYAWNDEQTEAVLVDSAGSDHSLTVRDPSAPGGIREQNWRFAARSECSLCHNPWAGYTLGANTLQMNRDHDYGSIRANQLRTLEHIGVFAAALPQPPQQLPRLKDPYDASLDLGERARSYLHANCSHCHRNGAGGTATIELMYSLDISKMNALDVRPAQGAFGISGARILAPGDPFGSTLYYRLATLGPGRMPRVGSRSVDERALQLIREWIEQLASHGPSGPAQDGHAEEQSSIETLRAAERSTLAARAEAIRRLTASTRTALLLLYLLDHEPLPESVRQEILSVTSRHSNADVRGLFDRFIPEAQRTKRLGSVIRPEAILALAGSAERGRHVFFESSSAQCKNCHRIQGAGTELGPDLSQIGQKYGRAELLEHILNPSQTIAPEQVSYVLETRSGKVLSGLLVKRTDLHVLLKDARNELIQVPSTEVERLAPQQKSLMPELLLQDMTAQEVADLVEYLASLK